MWLYDTYTDYYNYYYKQILICFNYILDCILYKKIYIQESQHFKYLYNYLYPESQIIHAKLGDEKSSIDITNHFSSIIQHDKLNHIEWDKIIKLCDKLEELNKSNKFHLDVRYTIQDNYYRVIYHYNEDDKIKFPLYDKKQIKEYQENNGYKKSVLYAEYKDQDITQIVKEYSGPLNNFYQDHGIKIHTCLIKDDNGVHILIEDESIIVTDSHGKDLKFNKEDILKLE